MSSKTTSTIVTAAAVSALLAGTWALAETTSGKADGDGKPAAKAPAVSMESALGTVRERSGGQVLEAELERRDGQPVYEIKTRRDDGRRGKYYVDATSGRVLKAEGEDHEREEDDDD